MGGSSGGGYNATAINSIQLQSSNYGGAIPVVYGANRVDCNLIDYDDFLAVAHDSSPSGGGKGGGSAPTQTSYSYQATLLLGICEGQIVSIPTVWREKEKFVDGATSALAQMGLTLFTGAEGQAAWSFMTSNHPDKAFSYSGTCYVAGAAYPLNDSAGPQNHNFEVYGKYQFGGPASVIDANAADVISDMLTANRYGGAYPSASLGDLTDYRNYCAAAGLFVSPVVDQKTQGSQLISSITDLTNAAIVWSEGLLKIRPYGDEALSGNGATYTPNVSPLYDLDDGDFKVDEGEDPVTINRGSPSDAHNSFSMECVDRANDYNKLPVTSQDQASIDLFGLREADSITAHFFCKPSIARFALELKKQRELHIRNTYNFRLGWEYAHLEAMDIVTITDQTQGLVKQPVRLTSMEEDDGGRWDITAEDFPAGVGHAAQYPSNSGAGYLPTYNADPGDVAAPVFIEPPARFAGGTGLALWIAVTGQGNAWGGCNVWVSLDGTSFQRFGTVTGGARYGALTANITGTGVTDTCSVALAGIGGQILSGSSEDVRLANTLCVVDNEFFAYRDATLTSANHYNLGTLNRGLYGSDAATHASGALFVRLDDTIAKSDGLDQLFLGEELTFKFQSFNVYGAGMQDLASLTPYTYQITGSQALSAGAAPTTLTAAGIDGGIALTWTLPSIPAGNPGIVSTLIERAPDASGSPGTWAQIGSSSSNTYTDSVLDGNVYHYRVRCQNALGNLSAYSNQVQITASIGAGGSGSGVLAVSISPGSLSKIGTRSTTISRTFTTGVAIAVASGGTAPYVSYAWTQISGGSIDANSPSSASTTFSSTFSPGGADVDRTAVYQVTVTDSASGTATMEITVDINAIGTF